ncbi:formin binding protein 4, partial [Homo sapiens]
MGKKSRAVPGRRPILQLSPPGPRGSTPGRDPEPEPDTEPDSTAAVPSQPAPSAATTTTTAVTAAAASDDSPSEDEQEAVQEVPRVVQNPPKPVMTTRPTAVKATGDRCHNSSSACSSCRSFCSTSNSTSTRAKGSSNIYPFFF